MNKTFKSFVYLVTMIGIAGYFIYLLIGQQALIDSKKKEMVVLQSKIEKEEETASELIKRKEIMETDEYIEKVAREKLGMVKPGEKIFVDVNK